MAKETLSGWKKAFEEMKAFEKTLKQQTDDPQAIAFLKHLQERHAYWKDQGLNGDQAWVNVRYEVRQAYKAITQDPEGLPVKKVFFPALAGGAVGAEAGLAGGAVAGVGIGLAGVTSWSERTSAILWVLSRAAAIQQAVLNKKNQEEKSKTQTNNITRSASTAATPPDPDDDRERRNNRSSNEPSKPFSIQKDQVEKVMFHERFGKFYKLKNSEVWYTKDKAGHGGSAWKAYIEKGKNLEWKADLDTFGKEMVGKHKGDSSKLLSLKEFSGSNF